MNKMLGRTQARKMTSEYLNPVREIAVSVNQLEHIEAGVFRWLSESIYMGKTPLKINSVQLIVAKILDRQGRVRNFKRRPTFDLYVFGTFRQSFKPTEKVAQTLADFYLETAILPNIVPVPKNVFTRNVQGITKKLQGGVIIYERR